MRKFKFYSTSLLILAVLFIGLSSCKKCKIEGENVDSGEIITDVLVYPQSGYMTYELGPDYHIFDNSAYGVYFEMSSDNGFSRSPVNYDQYSILAYPMLLNCNHFLSREVTRDDTNMTATFKITVTQCKDAECTEQRYIENYVIVPEIPDNYTILHDIQIIEQ